MFQTDLLINGKFVTRTGRRGDHRQPGHRPARSPAVREASAEQVDQAVAAAAAAFKKWGLSTPQERSLLLLKLADRVEQEAAAFAELESLNCGKPRVRVLNDEMPAIVDCFRFFAERRPLPAWEQHR